MKAPLSLLWVCTASAGLLVFNEPASAQRESATQSNGRRLFVGRCARCHGFTGEGGEGPALAALEWSRTRDLATLSALIQTGIPESGMPAEWSLALDDLSDLASYVLGLGDSTQALRVAESGASVASNASPGDPLTGDPLAGDPARGRELYRHENCGTCHIVAGEGRAYGPELTRIGARRGAAHLRQSLEDPSAAIDEKYLLVRAKRADGSLVEGMRLNEDNFTIQLRDRADRLFSLNKFELEAFSKRTDTSAMPVFMPLEPADLGDLVAYLTSLRGLP